MTPAETLPIINMWTRIYASHLSPKNPLAEVASKLDILSHNLSSDLMPPPPKEQLRYMQIFENKGVAMGCSNPHPHGQIWTTTSLPEEPELELQNLQKYSREQGGCNLLQDYAKLESEKGERTVFENNSFWAGCPWWATWPFEIMVVAKKHRRALTDLNQDEREDLAEVISDITRRYDNLFETSFPYSE